MRTLVSRFLVKSRRPRVLIPAQCSLAFAKPAQTARELGRAGRGSKSLPTVRGAGVTGQVQVSKFEFVSLFVQSSLSLLLAVAAAAAARAGRFAVLVAR